MGFPLVKKAYRVFHKDSIYEIDQPWTQVEIAYGQNANEAKMKSLIDFDHPYTELRARRLKSSDIVKTVEGDKVRSMAEYSERLKQWRQGMIYLVNSNPGAKVHIWSGQWGAFWRSNARGYTYNKQDAGIYDIKEAWKKVSHCGLEKQISFQII